MQQVLLSICFPWDIGFNVLKEVMRMYAYALFVHACVYASVLHLWDAFQFWCSKCFADFAGSKKAAINTAIGISGRLSLELGVW